jgi:hypothetical protein
MKKFFLIATMLLAFGSINAQISDVQQKGSYLYVYGQNNKKISQLSLSSSDVYLGMGSSFFIVKKGSYLYTYNIDSKKIAQLSLSSSDTFRSASGNSFNIQKGSYIYTYDQNCKKLSQRSL